jgi:hypothetical protein
VEAGVMSKVCPECRAEYRDDIRLCTECDIELQPITEPQQSKEDTGGTITAIGFLRIYAWSNLIAGAITGGMFILNSDQRIQTGGVSQTITNPFMIGLGMAFILLGIFGCAFLLVVAGIAEDVKAIRNSASDE